MTIFLFKFTTCTIECRGICIISRFNAVPKFFFLNDKLINKF